jgi:glycyl-tRNA synthetase beta chain
MLKDTLLVEIGTEELPPKSLKLFATTLHQQLLALLTSAELNYGKTKWYATPRRLAVKIEQLDYQQQDKLIEKKGPAVSVAFDTDGKPTKAAEGWARSNGITVEQAERIKTDKGEWLLHKAKQSGKTIVELLPEMVATAVAKLPIPRPMRWGSNKSQFVRPVHTLTLLYGKQVIPTQLFEINSSNVLQGHRFHHQGLVELAHADQYEDSLMKAHVVADYEQRQQRILSQIHAIAADMNVDVQVDDDLLDEVTSLVEWPIVLVGEFDEKFLAVPPEPLISSMKDHQKYFPVFSQQGQLVNKFVFVANIESKNPAEVIAGNEKVIRPRLSDAEFFFNTDKKQTLASRLTQLATVLFQQQLGTLKEKSERIAQLSEKIAQQLGEETSLAYRAGLLSKTDLMTEMVMEFPEVQGTMGKYYALHDGEDPAVAQALEDQYKPRFAGDELPKAAIGSIVAVADKIDTLVGIFGIKQPPKGDKDPFALRRAAIGLIRIIIEKALPLDIATLVALSTELYGDKIAKDTAEQVVEFILARFRAYYQEQGYRVDTIQAVLAKNITQPLDFEKRIQAVKYFTTLPEADALAAANKRVANILAKVDADKLSQFDKTLTTESAEKALAEQFESLAAKLTPLYQQKDYQTILTELTQLKSAIDNFFDQVMVMVDDEQVKTNRLTLLKLIKNSFDEVADISVLQ